MFIIFLIYTYIVDTYTFTCTHTYAYIKNADNISVSKDQVCVSISFDLSECLNI